jgi:hypothetical protein
MKLKMKKVEIYVRFANENLHYHKIMVDPKNILDPIEFPDEVFCTIDGLRVAIPRKEWDIISKDVI